MESFLKERKSKEISELNLSELNVKEIFTEDELRILNDTEDKLNSNRSMHAKESKSGEENDGKIQSFLFDRTKLVIKLLKICKAKMMESKETVLANGLNWLTKEIGDSILFKTDEQSLKKLEEMKKENSDMNTVLLWLQEYSHLNMKHKDGFSKTKVSESVEKETVARIHNSLSVSNSRKCTLLDIDEELFIKKDESRFLSYSEDAINNIEEPTFDIFRLESEVGAENILSTISCYIFANLGYYSLIKYEKFEAFINEIAKGYIRTNPYHTDLHAADVLQTCSVFMKFGKMQDVFKLSDLDCCSLLISCFIHDFKHPGKTNLFLINTGHPIAVQYNDISVLENYHIAESFKIIKSAEIYNIFSELNKDDYKTMRKRIIECVLATDMTFHAKQFTYLKVKIESLGISGGKNVEKIFEGLDKMALYSTQQEFLNIIIHACDISNPTKPFHIYRNWAERVMGEFWMQGDKERELGLPISFLCDRTTVSLPGAQIGFMDGIVLPFTQALKEIFPSLEFLIENVNNNKAEFKRIKEEEEAKKKLEEEAKKKLEEEAKK